MAAVVNPRLRALLTRDPPRWPVGGQQQGVVQPSAAAHASSSSCRQESSPIWCWHCCHVFEGKGVPLPVAYDDRRDIFKTKGVFCSFACAKAYNTDDGGIQSSVVGYYLSLLHKRMYGNFGRIIPAPPRRTLKVFGGALSIEEFRAKAGEGIIVHELPPKMVPIETIMNEQRASIGRIRPRPAQDLSENLDLSDVSVSRNETLRLRRPRPMPSDTNLLARTMGITLG